MANIKIKGVITIKRGYIFILLLIPFILLAGCKQGSALSEKNIVKVFASEGIKLEKNTEDLSAFTIKDVKPSSYKEKGKGVIVNIYFFKSEEEKNEALKEFNGMMKKLYMADVPYMPYFNKRAFDVENVIIMVAYDNVNMAEYDKKIQNIVEKLK